MAGPRVLVVGAGAVGQVYGRHAQLGGAEVTFYVRPARRDQVTAGYLLHPLNGRTTGTARLDGLGVVTDADEVRAAGPFDAVIITVPSDALAGPWLPALVAAAGDATIVMLGPGVEDRAAMLAAGTPEDRLVAGMISLIAYEAPLRGETRFDEPGVAYWFPPRSPGSLWGPEARTQAVVDLLRRGGQPMRRRTGASKQLAFLGAATMTYVLTLEAAGWRYDEVGGARSRQAADAARQAIAIVELSEGRAPVAMRLAGRPRTLWLVAKLAGKVPSWVAPIPLEPYLEHHFTKVRGQSLQHLHHTIDAGRAAGLPVDALERLAAAVA